MRYGVVRERLDGPLHLLAGNSPVALCGVRRPEQGWAVTMKGIVTAEYVRESLGVCENCRASLPARLPL